MRRQIDDCPFGGSFYKCSVEFGGFSGCCTTEPCSRGGTCPKENDRTPGRSEFLPAYMTYDNTRTDSSVTPSLTTLPTRATSASKEAEATLAILPVSNIAPVETSTRSALITNSSDRPLSTAYVTVSHQPSATSFAIPGSTELRRIPIAVIAGAAVGALVLLALAVFLFRCCKRRKQKSIYQAPVYVSPYNSNDGYMSQKARFSHSANIASFDGVQQLDGRGVGKPQNSCSTASRCFAKLPAEPVVRVD
jgi:hypothetical protein